MRGVNGRIFAFELPRGAEIARCPVGICHRTDAGDGISLAVGTGVLGGHESQHMGKEGYRRDLHRCAPVERQQLQR